MAPSRDALVVELSEHHVNGTARLLCTVLQEKVEESAWKARVLDRVGRGCVCIHATDRGDKAYIERARDGVVLVRSVEAIRPKVTVALPAKMIPKVLRLRQGPLKLPVVWDPPGRVIVKSLANRTIVVHGLFRHPLLAIKVLQVLSVPPKAGTRSR